MNKPINRLQALRPLSREHHHGLLLCWKIREGFKKGINPERIKSYAAWFWETYLARHFEAEERYVFPILENDNPLVKRALAEHRRLKRLFLDQKNVVKSLNRIEDELGRHIRFEERVLFNEIQERASSEQLRLVSAIHNETPPFEEWRDEFWK